MNQNTGKKLWLVTVEYQLVVSAANEHEAESEAEWNAGEDGSEPSLLVATKIKSIKDVPQEWMQAIPFGGDKDDERTVSQRLQSPNTKLTDAGPVTPDLS